MSENKENEQYDEELNIEDIEIKEESIDDANEENINIQSEQTRNDSSEEFTEQQATSSTKYVVIGLIAAIIIFGLIFNINKFYNPPSKVTTGSFAIAEGDHPSTETITEYTYNDLNFKKEGSFWIAELKTGNTIYKSQFYYGPREVEGIKLEGDTFHPLFQKKDIYITFDPTSENFTDVALAVAQLDTHFIRTFHKNMIAACDRNETEVCQDRPIVNCENTNDTAVIYLKKSSVPKVILSNNCVILEGEGWDLMRASENFLMRAYAIIK